MRAISRIGLAMAAAGLALAPAPSLAQTTSAPAPASNSPAPDSIGPRELSNFSLGGTPAQPAETPAITTSTPARTRPQSAPASVGRTTAPAQTPTAERRPAESTNHAAASTTSAPPPTPSPAPAFDTSIAAATTSADAPQPGFSAEPQSAPETLAPEQKVLLWPWLLLALVLGAAGAALVWRRRHHGAVAGGPEIDAFVAPGPAPAPPRAASPPRVAPAPTPAPPTPEPAKPVGIVSSRLRPWIDLIFAPIGCVVDDERVMIEFEVQLTNSGSAPARDVLVEASMFNAGASQEQDIGGFFARPIGQGERIEIIAPLQQISIRTSLVAPRQNIQTFDVGGKQVFVPLVAFNALYRAGNSGAQTSTAYMLGRKTKTEKLGPLRADLGPKVFSSLGTRPLEVGVRV